MTLRDDLVAARALIDTPSKWGQGARRRPCLCAADAVGDVAFGTAAWSPNNARENAMADALIPGVSASIFALIDFNDDEGTTHADVMALFDRAIAGA